VLSTRHVLPPPESPIVTMFDRIVQVQVPIPMPR
jgi:hypothetical protein